MIRKAGKNDIAQVASLYHSIHKYEQVHVSYTNWQEGIYPIRQTAEAALGEGTLYVGDKEGKIWGSMILNENQLECYKEGNWKWETDKVLVIHTMCIHPQERRCGYAHNLLDYAMDFAKAEKKDVLRLDTYEGNLPANEMYQKLGYHFAGTVKALFFNGKWQNMNLYEKKVV